MSWFGISLIWMERRQSVMSPETYIILTNCHLPAHREKSFGGERVRSYSSGNAREIYSKWIFRIVTNNDGSRQNMNRPESTVVTNIASINPKLRLETIFKYVYLILEYLTRYPGRYPLSVVSVIFVSTRRISALAVFQFPNHPQTTLRTFRLLEEANRFMTHFAGWFPHTSVSANFARNRMEIFDFVSFLNIVVKYIRSTYIYLYRYFYIFKNFFIEFRSIDFSFNKNIMAKLWK